MRGSSAAHNMDCNHCYDLGIREGYARGFKDAEQGSIADRGGDPGPARPERTMMEVEEFGTVKPVVKRKPTAANKKYAKAFKKLAPTFKKKNGSWKKDGFKKCSKASHKMCKK